MSLIQPSASPPKEPGSKEIIEEFILSDLDRCVVDMTELDRKVNSVYVSLRQYLAKRPDLNISVSLQDKQITLVKE